MLVEFAVFVPASRTCIFNAVVIPPDTTQYQLLFTPNAPIPGPTLTRLATCTTGVGTGFANLKVDNEPCNIPLNLPEVVGFGDFGGCNIFPVRWFENANDVPH